MDTSSETVAIVTGGSGGIGSSICQMFAREGIKVVIHYNEASEAARSLAAGLDPTGRSVRTVQADLTRESEAQALIDRTVEEFGRIDYLVNNAGWTRVIPEDKLDDLDDVSIDRIVRLKIHAPLYCIRAARPYLSEHGLGSVVNITSVSGVASRGSNHVYAAANAALSVLTRSLARSLAPTIRVNAVAPGFVNTGFAWPTDERMSNLVSKNNHIGRVVEPTEVAAIVRFFCLESLALTGEEIVVDGGIGRLGKRSSARSTDDG